MVFSTSSLHFYCPCVAAGERCCGAVRRHHRRRRGIEHQAKEQSVILYRRTHISFIPFFLCYRPLRFPCVIPFCFSPSSSFPLFLLRCKKTLTYKTTKEIRRKAPGPPWERNPRKHLKSFQPSMFPPHTHPPHHTPNR